MNWTPEQLTKILNTIESVDIPQADKDRLILSLDLLPPPAPSGTSTGLATVTRVTVSRLVG